MAKVPLKWGKVEDSGKVGINVPEDTTFASTDPALKVDGNIEATQLNGVTIGNSPKFTDNNTTYAFADGTNGFTVTPSGGQAQTVNITPSISNNVTGSGTSDCIAKFNGENTITSGPAIGTDTTKYLRNDGTWQVPPNTDTDTKNTAGATDTASKIYLVGAMSQDENPQTYSNGQVYATNGELTSGSLNTGEISASSASISGDIEAGGKVTCNNMNTYEVPITVTKSSGNWSIDTATAIRSGNTVMIQFYFKGNGSSVSVGSNAFVGKLSSGPLPWTSVNMVTYYASTTVVCNLDYDGNITVRILGAAISLTANQRTRPTGTYITTN